MSYTLLTLANIAVRTAAVAESGTLVLECVPDAGHDGQLADDADVPLALALHLNAHTFVLERGRPVSLVIAPSGQRIYSFLASVAGTEKRRTTMVRVDVPPPSSAGTQVVAEDIETFDQLLMQYAELSWSYGDADSVSVPSAPPPLPARPPTPAAHPANIKSNVEEARPVDDPALRGRLVLMDEANGEVVGELPRSMNITEDPALTAKSGSQAVVLEMHPDMYAACTGERGLEALGDDLLETRQVFARAVPPEEQDWIMKGATFVSQAISGSTSLLLSGITAASNFYITHSSPGTSKNATPTHSGSTSPITDGSPPQLTVTAASPSPAPSSPSPSTAALAKAYALSGQARAASAKTVDAVEGVIRRAVGAKPNPNSRYTPPSLAPSGPSEISRAPPPAYAVYTPKHRSRASLSQLEEEKKAAEQQEEGEGEEEGEPRPLGTKDKLLLSANLVITTIDDSARRVFDVTTDRIGAVVGHKFGPQAQQSTHLASHTARNIVLVYVDVRGFARRALITKTGKEFVKARFGGKEKAGSGAGTPVAGSGGSTPARTATPSPSNSAANKA